MHHSCDLSFRVVSLMSAEALPIYTSSRPELSSIYIYLLITELKQSSLKSMWSLCSWLSALGHEWFSSHFGKIVGVHKPKQRCLILHNRYEGTGLLFCVTFHRFLISSPYSLGRSWTENHGIKPLIRCLWARLWMWKLTALTGLSMSLWIHFFWNMFYSSLVFPLCKQALLATFDFHNGLRFI